MKDQYKALGDFGTLGLEVALSIFFGGGLGYYGDEKLGTAPWLMVVGAGFGVAAAVRTVLRAARRMRVISEREEREQGNPAPVYEKPDAEAPSREAPGREERDETP